MTDRDRADETAGNPGQDFPLRLPEQVQFIIGKLEKNGFEAYAVGGCVRDLLLGRKPKDYDITTNAKPAQVKRIFKNTVDTGIAHGTVTVVLRDGAYEVTTYRIDGVYEDGRHPKEVTFSADLKEDLARRDFTVNAMALHPERGLVDVFGGEEDLKHGLIRCVGRPSDRFGEDALRILRALRFAAQLGFSIDPATEEAIRLHAPDLKKISAERIRDEVMKMITSDHPEMWLRAYEDGISAQILPEFDRCMQEEQNSPYHLYNVGLHTVKAMEAIRPDPVLRLTMLLHDLGKAVTHTQGPDGKNHFYGHAHAGEQIAETVLRRLKFDNDTIRTVTKLVRYHDLRPKASEAPVRRAVHEIGTDLFPLYLEVQKADAAAKNPERMQYTFERIRAVEAIYETILSRRDCLTVADLAINGNDLIAAGAKPGKEIGKILDIALMAVLEEPSLNDHDLLMMYASQMI